MGKECFIKKRLFWIEIERTHIAGSQETEECMVHAEDIEEAARLAILMAGGYDNEPSIKKIYPGRFFYEEDKTSDGE